MFKKVISIFLLIFSFSYSSTPTNFKVSYDPDYAPYSYNIDGEPYGLFIDIYKYWGKANNYTVEFVNGKTWDNALSMVKDNQVDFFLGTEPYLEWMEGSLPFYKIKTSLFALKSVDNKNIKKIGIIGSDYEDDLKKEFTNIKILSYDTYEELVNALISKKVDTIYDDSVAINDFIFKNRQNHLINKLDGFSSIGSVSAISNDSKKIDIFNKSFLNLDKEVLQKIESSWITKESQRYFSQSTTDFLTKSEREWLEKNPITRVAVMNYWPSDDDGNSLHTGILKLINKYIGTNIIPIKFDAWKDGYEKATKADGLHGIMGLSYSKEREEKYFHYTTPYNFTPCYLVTKNSDVSIKSFNDIKDKTIYLKEKSIVHNMMEEKSPSTKIKDIKTVDEMYEKISSSSEADAFIAYFIDEEKIKKYDLKIVEVIYDRYGEVSIGVNHKYNELSSIINKAFKIIPKIELAKVRDKKYTKITNTDSFKISQKQLEYLENKKVLKICTNPNWRPIEFTEDSVQGISIDVLSFIKDTLNLEYKFIKTSSWSQSQEFLKEKKCDILPSAIKTPKREEFAKFTNPYLNYDLAIITRDDKPLSSKIDSFLTKKMSRVQGSGLISKIKSKYPTISIIETKTVKESFEAVIDGEVDFTIATLPVLQYFKSKYALKGLQVVGYTDMKYNISMAVRNDEPILVDILNIALNKISKQTYKIVHDKWASVKVVQETNWTLIFQITGVIILIFIFILFNNRKLKAMVLLKTQDIQEQKSELESLVSSFDRNVIFTRTDLKGNITHVSEAFCHVSGYSFDELIGKPHNIVRHPSMEASTFKEIWEALQNGCSIKVEVKNLKKDGGFYWVESKFNPDYNKNGELIGYSALRVDITSKKEVEELSENLETKVQERTEDLEISKKSTEEILANILLPVLITSKQRRVVIYANQFACDLYEKTYDEIINSPLDDIYTLDNGPEELIRKLTTQGRVDGIEEKVTTHLGKQFTALLSVTPLNFKGEDCFIGMTVDISKQKEMENTVRSMHKHTRDSIEYASLIQGALIPNSNVFSSYFKDYFVTWAPKDTVGGDIWLFDHLRDENECLVMYIDCTGHGVPGAFVTMIVKAIEREIISKIKDDINMDVSPAWIMGYFNQSMKILLKQDNEDSLSNAGWDGGIIYYNKKDKILKFAGAETPLFYVDINGKLNTIKGNRYSVGYKKCAMDYKYKETVLKVEDGMKFYCTTDGYLDQNGGEKDFPFGKKRFTQIIEKHHNESMAEQQTVFMYEMMEYEACKKDNDRNDDITVIGFEI